MSVCSVTFSIFVPEFSLRLRSVAAGPIPGLAESWHLCCAAGIQGSEAVPGGSHGLAPLHCVVSLYSFLKHTVQYYTF